MSATAAAANANEAYCTFTLASDVTAGGLPSEQEISKDLESTNTSVSLFLFAAESYVKTNRVCKPKALSNTHKHTHTGQKDSSQGCHYGHAGRRSHAPGAHAGDSILHQLGR